MIVFADSAGQGVYGWAVGWALSTAPTNVLLPLLNPHGLFPRGSDVSVSTWSIKKKKQNMPKKQAGFSSSKETCQSLQKFRTVQVPPDLPQSRGFHPSLPFPGRIDTFPVSRCSAEPVSTKFTHTILNQCANAQKKRSTSKQTV